MHTEQVLSQSPIIGTLVLPYSTTHACIASEPHVHGGNFFLQQHAQLQAAQLQAAQMGASAQPPAQPPAPEHHEIEEALNDLAATDMSAGAWLHKFKDLDHDYRHHIDEEEEEHFPDFADHLDEKDREHMRGVFERRKKEEKAEAEVTPEAKEDAKE